MTKPEREKEQIKDESTAMFVAGQIVGLASLLNVRALEKFLESDRPRKTDFKYTRQLQEIIKFRHAVFKNSMEDNSKSKGSVRSKNNP